MGTWFHNGEIARYIAKVRAAAESASARWRRSAEDDCTNLRNATRTSAVNSIKGATRHSTITSIITVKHATKH